MEKWLGITARRQFPVFSRRSLHQLVQQHERNLMDQAGQPTALLLSDPFNEYMHPEVGLAAVQVLRRAGYNVRLLPVVGAGRTMISKGFVDAARRQAVRLLAAIERLDPEGRLPILGLEPSEIYTLRDEYFDLLPGDPRLPGIAGRAWMIDEFLVRPGSDGRPPISSLVSGNDKANNPVYLHGHCYQKAQPPRSDGYPVGVVASKLLVELCGFQVNVVDSGCCGMAGAFGYETEHFDLSMRVGELALFPALRAAKEKSDNAPIFVATGVSCRSQIEDGLGRLPLHPIQLVAQVTSK
jgi:Fe-S oxidoreductase